MNGADILVENADRLRCRHCFWRSGRHECFICEALRHREDEITHVMARDERSAGYMADAYGRFTNRPGIVECPSRAGPMHTLPPIAESDASNVPAILLTIDMPLPVEGRGC